LEKEKGKEKGKHNDIHIYSNMLCDVLQELCINDTIVFSNKDCILGFLDAYIGANGYFTDHYITTTNKSKELLIEIQQMLNYLHYT
jgi:hypothetical protein